MSGTARRAEFFAVEAEEYLADLELVASPHDGPDAERMVRGARALRGAALVAGLGTYARAAAGLEALARQLRDETVPWDSTTREHCLATIAALYALLPRATAWDATADRDALALAERSERFAGSSPVRQAATSQALTAGVRAFIAKESALIAGSLERAARALSPTHPPEALAAVLERMRSLRGLGASAELSPLPEMLDAMEIATRMLLGDDPPPPDVAEVFDEAARALATMARTIADSGKIIAPPELDRVAMHLLSAYAEEPDVVSIDELTPDGEASVVHRGTPPGPPPDAVPVPIELVGVGDHLLLIADTLARPALPVVRDLRLFVLHRTLATMPPRSATGQFLAPLTSAITDAISQRLAGRQLDLFIAMLRDCGRFLVDSGGSNDRTALLGERDRLAAALRRGELGAALSVPKTHRVIPAADLTVSRVDETSEIVEQIVAIEQLAPTEIMPEIRSIPVAAVPARPPAETVSAASDEILDTLFDRPLPLGEEIVSIESLAPDPIPDIATLAPDPVERAPTVSLLPAFDDDDLIGTPIVPIEALAPGDARPVAAGLIPREAPGAPSRLEAAWRRQRELERTGVAEAPSLERLLRQDIIPIESLLYRGSAAVARAGEIRAALLVHLNQSSASLDQIRHELDELLDLVVLARDAA